mmetsp:Transcript_79873/g.226104  ORF Transcript_79873/g.226104 Transcript_79873/m.226104 type:complete len:210 (+) Transcript_79873:173-802(+)
MPTGAAALPGAPMPCPRQPPAATTAGGSRASAGSGASSSLASWCSAGSRSGSHSPSTCFRQAPTTMTSVTTSKSPGMPSTARTGTGPRRAGRRWIGATASPRWRRSTRGGCRRRRRASEQGALLPRRVPGPGQQVPRRRPPGRGEPRPLRGDARHRGVRRRRLDPVAGPRGEPGPTLDPVRHWHRKVAHERHVLPDAAVCSDRDLMVAA